MGERKASNWKKWLKWSIEVRQIWPFSFISGPRVTAGVVIWLSFIRTAFLRQASSVVRVRWAKSEGIIHFYYKICGNGKEFSFTTIKTLCRQHLCWHQWWKRLSVILLLLPCYCPDVPPGFCTPAAGQKSFCLCTAVHQHAGQGHELADGQMPSCTVPQTQVAVVTRNWSVQNKGRGVLMSACQVVSGWSWSWSCVVWCLLKAVSSAWWFLNNPEVTLFSLQTKVWAEPIKCVSQVVKNVWRVTVTVSTPLHHILKCQRQLTCQSTHYLQHFRLIRDVFTGKSCFYVVWVPHYTPLLDWPPEVF